MVNISELLRGIDIETCVVFFKIELFLSHKLTSVVPEEKHDYHNSSQLETCLPAY